MIINFVKWGNAMQRIAICDDEKKILLELEETTDIFFKGYCVDCKIQTYQSSENLWYDLQDGIYYDLFLLDIEMPQAKSLVGIGLNLFQMLSGFSLILVVCTLYFFLRVQETRREQEYTAR